MEGLCDDCEAISPMMRGTDTLKRASKVTYDVTISGVNADMPKIQSVDLSEGRFIAGSDVAHGTPLQ